MSEPEFKYVISFGTFCITSMILKKLKFKQFSCPFDWVFSSTKMIADCLEDNFTKFLDKKYYIPNKKKRGCGHTIYGGSCFNHYNPLLNPDHYDYYVRCVDRFRKTLTSTDYKLFISSCITNTTKIQATHLT